MRETQARAPAGNCLACGHPADLAHGGCLLMRWKAAYGECAASDPIALPKRGFSTSAPLPDYQKTDKPSLFSHRIGERPASMTILLVRITKLFSGGGSGCHEEQGRFLLRGASKARPDLGTSAAHRAVGKKKKERGGENQGKREENLRGGKRFLTPKKPHLHRGEDDASRHRRAI